MKGGGVNDSPGSDLPSQWPWRAWTRGHSGDYLCHLPLSVRLKAWVPHEMALLQVDLWSFPWKQYRVPFWNCCMRALLNNYTILGSLELRHETKQFCFSGWCGLKILMVIFWDVEKRLQKSRKKQKNQVHEGAISHGFSPCLRNQLKPTTPCVKTRNHMAGGQRKDELPPLNIWR